MWAKSRRWARSRLESCKWARNLLWFDCSYKKSKYHIKWVLPGHFTSVFQNFWQKLKILRFAAKKCVKVQNFSIHLKVKWSQVSIMRSLFFNLLITICNATCPDLNCPRRKPFKTVQRASNSVVNLLGSSWLQNFLDFVSQSWISQPSTLGSCMNLWENYIKVTVLVQNIVVCTKRINFC